VKISFVHICDYANVSKDGKLSVMGIFDSISPPALPHKHPAMYLAFEIAIVPAELGRSQKLTIKLVNADGKTQIELSAELTVQAQREVPGGTTLKIPQVSALYGVQLAKAGQYSFDIFINGHHSGSAAFDVVARPKQNPPAAAGEAPRAG
jgi:hypothetical protein